jgi:hypothetical protein
MEMTMVFLDAVMIGGIGMAVVACACLIRMQLKSLKQAGGHEVHLEPTRRGERLDLYMAIVWSGFLLVQVTSILHHIQSDGSFQFTSLSLVAFAAVVFVCGGFAARLLLRREMRLYEEKRGEYL